MEALEPSLVQSPLLQSDDVHPVGHLHPQANTPILLVCEHAGNEIPASLGLLGLSSEALHSHIGWDIGAFAVAQELAKNLSSELVYQRYSRLVADCNRPLDSPALMPEVSAGIPIPDNVGISDAQRQQRIKEIWQPFSDAIARTLDSRDERSVPTALVCVHSFTPSLNGIDRLWHIGLLFNRDDTLVSLLARHLRHEAPDTFLPEYGSNQYEVTVSPRIGLRAADECVIVREMVRAVAKRMGQRVSFSPMTHEDAGNGLHIHISLVDRDGAPCTADADNPARLNTLAGSFFCGIRKYMPSFLALTASSVVSYERLIPHRWSAAFNNFAENDREAALRLCPVVGLDGFDAASQLHVEYRAADATANPYSQLAFLARAGLQGIRDHEPAPTPTTGDLSLLTSDQLAEIDVVRLPLDLPAALDALDHEPLLRTWFPREFVDVFLAHKAGEMAFLQGKDASEIRRLYMDAY